MRCWTNAPPAGSATWSCRRPVSWAPSTHGHRSRTSTNRHAVRCTQSVRACCRPMFTPDLDLLGDQDTACLQRLVPGQAPLLAVEAGLGREQGPGVAPRVLGQAAVGHVERHGLGDTAHREVASQPVTTAGAPRRTGSPRCAGARHDPGCWCRSSWRRWSPRRGTAEHPRAPRPCPRTSRSGHGPW